MQILNNVTSTFFPLNSTRSTSKDLDVRIARDTLNQAGSPQKPKQDILFNSVFINSRRVPKLEASGPLAAFRVNDAIALLSRQSESRKIPIVDDLGRKERFSLLKLRQLDELSTSLTSLKQSVSGLLKVDALNLKSSSSPSPSTRSERVQIVVGKDASLDSFNVTPVRLTKGAILASDEQSTPLGTLGLSGSFFVNGVKITVESSDTLIDLKNKINFGEDQNRNGVLDKTEDVNNNGTLDIIQTKNTEFVPAIYIVEDLDGDGEIDLGEDVNDNGQLDGGTAESKVLALIKDNRLVLVGQAGGRDQIDLLDSDDVLLELGFFELNFKGFPVQKEFQFDSEDQDLLENLIQQPQTAKIEVNGKPVFSDTNVFSEVIEDTDVVIKSASEKAAQINVFIDAESFFTQIKTLFDQFNNSISKINDLLGASRTFARDGDIQDIRNDLTIEPQEGARKLADRNEEIDAFRGRPGNPFATGIRVVNTEKNSQQDVAIASAVQAVKSGITRAFQSKNENLLRRLGSIGVRSLADNTFVLDERELRRGLDSNTTEIFDLFTNPETGILPSLEESLNTILREELGELAIEENEIIVQSRSPRVLAENFRKFTENTNLENTIQTLIAVA
ncbi:MAG: flagellar filament capping protein FliD [Nitrospina sp.]|nr:flagellar filament capping protein FliD [Nitrospina sp.]MBT3508041.1 flagellar filament capping protein FliD [Nitrospina sp.]MBT3876568.1 flagellar filament capping protein FliD [Nitrospina sp.]MBT4558299.1 flagellar filament capping protein FliD [Nitrospina sp.]MBT5348686.1 flagellar filament capping protein FliD [Nitrospina sp.]